MCIGTAAALLAFWVEEAGLGLFWGWGKERREGENVNNPRLLGKEQGTAGEGFFQLISFSFVNNGPKVCCLFRWGKRKENGEFLMYAYSIGQDFGR